MLGATATLGRVVDPYGFHLPAGEPHRARSSDGLDRSPAYVLDRGLLRLVELDRVVAALPPEGQLDLIVGDSVALQIDARILARRLGGHWHNLAWGGASIVENLDLLDHLLGHSPVRTIVWGVSMARVRGGGGDRMARTIAMAASPWRHHLTAQSVLASALVLRRSWLGIPYADSPPPVADTELAAWGTERQRIEHLAAEWPEGLEERLAALATRARRLGVDLRLMILPMHPLARRMFETALPARVRALDALLQGHCTLRLDQPGRWATADFRDALHLRIDLHPRLSHALADTLAAGCR